MRQKGIFSGPAASLAFRGKGREEWGEKAEDIRVWRALVRVVMALKEV